MNPANEQFIGLFDVRDVQPEDKNFILATFLRGIYYGDSWFSLIPKAIFMENYKKVGEALVANRTIKVACLKDDPSVIIGYSIMSHDFQTLDYVYVKSVWRHRGVARALCPLHPQRVTHLTKLGHSLLVKINNPIFNPF